MFLETFLLAIHFTYSYSFISQEKDKRKSTNNLSKACHWKLIFVICYLLPRESVGTQGTLPCKHLRPAV